MPKPRVYELARELGLSSQEIIEKLKAMGIEAKAPSSSVDEDQAVKFKRHVRLESQSSKKNRVYGSEEDEGERDALEKEREARIAAERAERFLAKSKAANTVRAYTGDLTNLFTHLGRVGEGDPGEVTLADLRTWLDAQQTRRNAELSLAQARRSQLVNAVTLYKALGGGA